MQNWSHAQNSWEWNLWTHTPWFHTSDGSVHSPDPCKVHSLIKCYCLFLKNLWSIKNPGHIQIIWWDPLDPPKSDPSDSDSLGHLTHFQPWSCQINTRLTGGNGLKLIQPPTNINAYTSIATSLHDVIIVYGTSYCQVLHMLIL